MKKILILFISLSMLSCAKSKEFIIDNKKVVVEPYGWFDNSAKNDSINYKINVPNIVISTIFCETFAVPIILTGIQLWEPSTKK